MRLLYCNCSQADELTARLRSVGSRVRKSLSPNTSLPIVYLTRHACFLMHWPGVMEGYITDPSASTPRSSHSSPTKPTSALRSEARIFQSANDTLREVY